MKVCQDENFTAPLGQLASSDLELAGGKGANLGALIRAGFHVPPGFVITTPAYQCFIEANSIESSLQAVQSGAAEEINLGVFESAPIPPAVEEAIRKAYRALGGGPVAVRSSATSEDLPQAAFAGQQDTFLNVIDEQTLLEAVRRCWASLWSERAIAYRARQGIDPISVKLAVVVQSMVAAETAGGMFTANPVSGERDEIVIDATRRLVDGQRVRVDGSRGLVFHPEEESTPPE